MATWSEHRIRSVILGYAAAASTAGLSIILQLVVAPQRTEPIFEDMGFFLWLCGCAILFSAISAMPFAAPLMYVTERWKIRSVLFYTIGGAVAGMLALFVLRLGYLMKEDIYTLRLVSIGGIVAGLIYWLVAGRRAGA